MSRGAKQLVSEIILSELLFCNVVQVGLAVIEGSLRSSFRVIESSS